MARKITILEHLDAPIGAWKAVVCYWADVPSAAQSYYANASAGSAFKSASLSELGAIQDGSVREKVDTVSFPAEANASQESIDLALLANLSQWQDIVNNEAAATLTQYGRYWNGTAWVDPA